jgi:hypothetical protein
MDWTLGTLLRAPAPRTKEVALEPKHVLRVAAARGGHVTCRLGCVWITAPGELNDIFLFAGQTWEIPGPGLVLVEAEGRAIVTLGC